MNERWSPWWNLLRDRDVTRIFLCSLAPLASTLPRMPPIPWWSQCRSNGQAAPWRLCLAVPGDVAPPDPELVFLSWTCCLLERAWAQALCHHPQHTWRTSAEDSLRCGSAPAGRGGLGGDHHIPGGCGQGDMSRSPSTRCCCTRVSPWPLSVGLPFLVVLHHGERLHKGCWPAARLWEGRPSAAPWRFSVPFFHCCFRQRHRGSSQQWPDSLGVPVYLKQRYFFHELFPTPLWAALPARPLTFLYLTLPLFTFIFPCQCPDGG